MNVISTERSERRNLLQGQLPLLPKKISSISSVRVNPPFGTRFPRGVTFIIVGPKRTADVNARASNNIEDGTSAAREHLRSSA
jgi:hypothetical protein